MSYFNKNKQSSQQQQKPMQNPPNKQFQQKQPMQKQQQQQEPKPDPNMLGFAQEEAIFMENVFVKLSDMIPNEQGENTEIMEMITTCLQILGARLDSQSGFIGDSA